jgi:chromosomal replication initiation ATPase DnaA
VTRDEAIDIARSRYPAERAAVLSPTRGTPQAAWTRQCAMYLMYMTMDTPCYVTVGKAFDRDRTTVRHAVLVAREGRLTEQPFDVWCNKVLIKDRPDKYAGCTTRT